MSGCGLSRVRSTLASLSTSRAPVFLVSPFDANGIDYRDISTEISNFHGAMPAIFVSNDKAVLLTDARYFTMAKSELDPAVWTPVLQQHQTPLSDVINHHFPNHTVVLDQRFTPQTTYETLKKDNIDLHFATLPFEFQPKFTHLFALPLTATGASFAQKTTKTLTHMKEHNINLLFVNRPDEIAYLTNLRAHDDIPNAPVPRSFAIFQQPEQKLHLFFSQTHYETVKQAIAQATSETVSIHLHDYFQVDEILKSLINSLPEGSKASHNGKINLLHAQLFFESSADVTVSDTILQTMKAQKTPEELEAFRKSHIADGLALSRFIFWLQRNSSKILPTSDWTLCEKLLEFRKQCPQFHSLSFATIMGGGPNGAIIHYKPTAEKNSTVDPDTVLLIDSGGHYMYGATTDVTRTLWLGQKDRPSSTVIKACTAVLEGYFACATLKFPADVTMGTQLDALARMPLNKALLETYGHSTGHGVGSMLHVHEFPVSLAQRETVYSTYGIKEGMVYSVEPGYYEEGAFGCRYESLVEVGRVVETGYLCMEVLTCVPFDLALVDVGGLSDGTLDALNDYHGWVRVELSAAAMDEELVEDWSFEERREFILWLEEVTKPVERGQKKQIPAGMY